MQGPDDIPPAFQQELGSNAEKELLAIFDLSFETAKCPQIWRTATIIPLLKARKSPCELGSYRPISLISCVSKVMERMVADRLYYSAETRGILNNQQAGFRKGRGSEDQTTKVIQAIQDGSNNKPKERSVLVLLDFSKAYDTVWREKLIISLLEQGVSLPGL